MLRSHLSLICGILFAFGSVPVTAAEHVAGVPPQEALQRLKDGNARFAAGEATHPHSDSTQLKETSEHGQHPFATVLACSDSRVPLPVIFDQGIGSIFGIKVAGNVSGKSQLGSIEYGVVHAGTALVVVLGHTQCGAVTAACTGGGHEGNIESLVKAIEPAVKAVEKQTGKSGNDIVAETVTRNVFTQIRNLFAGSEILRDAVKEKKAMVVGAVYDISTGKVQFLGEHPKQQNFLNPKPKAEEPKVEEPKAEEPKVEEPKVEEPKVEEPKVEEPKVEEPKVEEPKVENGDGAKTAQTAAVKQAESKPVRPSSIRAFRQNRGTLFGR